MISGARPRRTPPRSTTTGRGRAAVPRSLSAHCPTGRVASNREARRSRSALPHPYAAARTDEQPWRRLVSHSTWMAMRSLTRDGDVTKTKLPPGTVRRIAGFAAPYKREIAIFLVLVVVDAVIERRDPAAVQADHRRRVGPTGAASRGVVVGIALVIAGLAIVDAGLDADPALVLRADRRGPDLRPAHRRCSTTCSGCRSRSSPAPRPARWSAGSTTTCSARSRRSPARCPRSCRNVVGRRPGARRDVLPVLADHPDRRWCCCRSSSSRPGWVGPQAAGASPARRCSSTPR